MKINNITMSLRNWNSNIRFTHKSLILFEIEKYNLYELKNISGSGDGEIDLTPSDQLKIIGVDII